MSSYLYPGEPADDDRAQCLAPAETLLHERWLQAVTDRAPGARWGAERLVAVLCAQTDKWIVMDADLKTCVGDGARHDCLDQLFWAGLICRKGLIGRIAALQLILF